MADPLYLAMAGAPVTGQHPTPSPLPVPTEGTRRHRAHSPQHTNLLNGLHDHLTETPPIGSASVSAL